MKKSLFYIPLLGVLLNSCNKEAKSFQEKKIDSLEKVLNLLQLEKQKNPTDKFIGTWENYHKEYFILTTLKVTKQDNESLKVEMNEFVKNDNKSYTQLFYIFKKTETIFMSKTNYTYAIDTKSGNLMMNERVFTKVTK